MNDVMQAVGVFFSYAVLAVFAQNAVFTRGLGVSRLVQLVGDERTSSGWFALLLCVIGAPHARAALFDDEEARRQIKDLSISTNERIDTLSKAQFDLVSQIQALREENARLRGQLETLVFELDSAKKRQQDFYVDL